MRDSNGFPKSAAGPAPNGQAKPPGSLGHLASLVFEMRRYQRLYYRTKARDLIFLCRDLERRVDSELDKIFVKCEEQLQLPFDDPAVPDGVVFAHPKCCPHDFAIDSDKDTGNTFLRCKKCGFVALQ